MRRHRLPVRAVVVVATLSVLVTGCGGGSAPGVANVGSSIVSSTAGSSATSQSDALLVAGRCLRQNGLVNFPDPSIASSGPAKGTAILDKQSLRSFSDSVVSHAMVACNSALQNAGIGNGGSNVRTPQEIQDGLAFAQCVRRHGISNFPDPNGQGQFDLAGTGINEHALTPAQLAAAHACLSTAHGAVHIPQQSTAASSSGA